MDVHSGMYTSECFKMTESPETELKLAYMLYFMS